MSIKPTRSLVAALATTVLGGALAACSGGAISPSAAPTAQSIATQSAPTAAAVATRAAPTVQALATSGAVAATQGAPTAQALATQSAPTVQALATRSAPTVQALATQVAPVAATANAEAPVHILGVQSTATDQTITLQNSSTSSVDLGGWTLQVGTASVQLPSGLTVPAGQTVTLHTMSGTSSGSEVYLGSMGSAIASQLKPGARVLLQNPSGSPATAFTIPSA